MVALAPVTVLGQAPQLINYQAIARDNGQLYNGTLDVKFTVRNGSCTGTPVFSEEHLGLNTNAYGLFNAKIGGGNLLSGSFTAINWNSGGAHFLEVELRFAGNSTYTTLPCSPTADQFVSVPYALNGPAGPQGPAGPTGPSGNNGNPGPTGPTGAANILGTKGYVLKFNTPTTAGNSIIYQDSVNNSRVGVLNGNPQGLLHVGNNSLNDDIIFEGTAGFAFNTKSYPNNQLMMIMNPTSGAFRLGTQTSGQWNGNKMGPLSIAVGIDGEASGSFGSMAIGAYSQARGAKSLVFGSALRADSTDCIAIGFGFNQGSPTTNSRSSTVLIASGSPFPTMLLTRHPATAKPLVAIGGTSLSNNAGPIRPKSTLEVIGSMAFTTDNFTNSTIALTDTHYVAIIVMSSSTVVNFPDAAKNPGRTYVIKKQNAYIGNIALTSAGGLFEGTGTTFSLPFNGSTTKESYTFISDGAGWWIINKY